jgi:hypothetical protein
VSRAQTATCAAAELAVLVRCDVLRANVVRAAALDGIAIGLEQYTNIDCTNGRRGGHHCRAAEAHGGRFGQAARICDECLDLSWDILVETLSP